MRRLFNLWLVAFLCAVAQVHAAKNVIPKEVRKERLVLMPLRIGDEDASLQSAMEIALVEGLGKKYEVFSGERVRQKAKEAFNKESRNTSKKECDETRCMQDIAGSFQSELIGLANVTKQNGGYFLALSIQNIFDEKAVYSKSLPCENCNAFKVVEKLKELAGGTAAGSDAPSTSLSVIDQDSILWTEVQKSQSEDDYKVYLRKYPGGHYSALAKAELQKFDENRRKKATEIEQKKWDDANKTGFPTDYEKYLEAYPKGNFVELAKLRIEQFRKVSNDCVFPFINKPAPLWVCDAPVEGVAVSQIGSASPVSKNDDLRKISQKTEAVIYALERIATRMHQTIVRAIKDYGDEKVKVKDSGIIDELFGKNIQILSVVKQYAETDKKNKVEMISTQTIKLTIKAPCRYQWKIYSETQPGSDKVDKFTEGKGDTGCSEHQLFEELAKVGVSLLDSVRASDGNLYVLVGFRKDAEEAYIKSVIKEAIHLSGEAVSDPKKP